VTITQLQEQIAAVEGFRVSFERLGALDVEIPLYPFDVMSPSKWKISDWKRMRLGPYVLIFKNVHVYRGDDTIVKSDLQLARLRDSYYEARYGTLEPVVPENVIPMDAKKVHARAKPAGRKGDA
jgi:hypothetical protein